MQTDRFISLLNHHPEAELRFLLPGGGVIPAHAHITQVGRVERRFLDCGGVERRQVATSLQAWVAEDVDHRLSAGKLGAIFAIAAPLLDEPGAPVEVEFQQLTLGRFLVEDAALLAGCLTIQLAAIEADCLAKDVCLPSQAAETCCGSGATCC